MVFWVMVGGCLLAPALNIGLHPDVATGLAPELNPRLCVRIPAETRTATRGQPTAGPNRPTANGGCQTVGIYGAPQFLVLGRPLNFAFSPLLSLCRSDGVDDALASCFEDGFGSRRNLSSSKSGVILHFLSPVLEGDQSDHRLILPARTRPF